MWGKKLLWSTPMLCLEVMHCTYYLHGFIFFLDPLLVKVRLLLIRDASPVHLP